MTELAESSRKTLSEGYYEVGESGFPVRSLSGALRGADRTPIIAEVKFRSPAEGPLRSPGSVAEIASAYERGGAAGISVLTEPKHFAGRLDYVTVVKRSVSLPVLMKDIVIDKVQIEAASSVGADAILLMVSLFTAGLTTESLPRMIDHAHDHGLEVLLEAHTDKEFRSSLESEADIVGINNRDLDTLKVSLNTSRRLLRRRYDKRSKPVICESGISRRDEVVELLGLGADGFLVGSAIMKSGDIEGKLRSLVGE